MKKRNDRRWLKIEQLEYRAMLSGDLLSAFSGLRDSGESPSGGPRHGGRSAHHSRDELRSDADGHRERGGHQDREHASRDGDRDRDRQDRHRRSQDETPTASLPPLFALPPTGPTFPPAAPGAGPTTVGPSNDGLEIPLEPNASAEVDESPGQTQSDLENGTANENTQLNPGGDSGNELDEIRDAGDQTSVTEGANPVTEAERSSGSEDEARLRFQSRLPLDEADEFFGEFAPDPTGGLISRPADRTEADLEEQSEPWEVSQESLKSLKRIAARVSLTSTAGNVAEGSESADSSRLISFKGGNLRIGFPDVPAESVEVALEVPMGIHRVFDLIASDTELADDVAIRDAVLASLARESSFLAQPIGDVAVPGSTSMAASGAAVVAATMMIAGRKRRSHQNNAKTDRKLIDKDSTE